MAAWKKLRFILSVRSDFHIADSLLIVAHAFVSSVSMSVSVDETLVFRGKKYTTIFKTFLFSLNRPIFENNEINQNFHE